MFSVPLEELPLSKREKAYCKRAELVNAAQILLTSLQDRPRIGQLFSASRFENLQEIASHSQTPNASSVLDLLENGGVTLKPVWHEPGSPSAALSEKFSSRKRRCGDRGRCCERLTSSNLTLTTGDQDIDVLLGGGVRTGCLTEIVGESASGKSQLAMQTAVHTALGLNPVGVDPEGNPLPTQSHEDDLYRALRGQGVRPTSSAGAVAFVVSGGHAVEQMLLRRMKEMAQELVKVRYEVLMQSLPSPPISKSARNNRSFQGDQCSFVLEEVQELARKQLLVNIHLTSARDYESLEHAISYALPALAARLKAEEKAALRLIVIDDLPELMVEEEGTTSGNLRAFTLRRSREVCEITDRLKQFATPFGSRLIPSSSSIAIMVINQVTNSSARDYQAVRPLLQEQAWSQWPMEVCGEPPLSSGYQDGFVNGVLASSDIAAVMQARTDIGNGVDAQVWIERISSNARKAALGHSWVNCLNVRIMLSKTSTIVPLAGRGQRRGRRVTARRAVSVINPFAKAGHGWDPHVDFVILPTGLQALSTSSLASHNSVTVSHALQNIDEEQLWSSFDQEFSAADLRILDGHDERSLPAQAQTQYQPASQQSTVDEDKDRE